MVQLSVSTVRSLTASHRELDGAGRLASDKRSTNSKHGSLAEAGGTGISDDRQDKTVSADFVTKEKARSIAAINAAKGISLLQKADEELVSIGIKLQLIASLALGADSSRWSNAKRAQFDVLFQLIKGEIDTIAATTTFDGAPLLQGGGGPGGEFQFSFQIGTTGLDEHREINILIAPASVSDLSAALVADSLATQSGTSSMRSNVAAAQDALNVIQGGVAGDIERISIAIHNMPSIGQGREMVRAALFDPVIPINLSRKIAGQAGAESSFILSDHAVDHTRQLLIKFGAAATDFGKKAA